MDALPHVGKLHSARPTSGRSLHKDHHGEFRGKASAGVAVG